MTQWCSGWQQYASTNIILGKGVMIWALWVSMRVGALSLQSVGFSPESHFSPIGAYSLVDGGLLFASGLLSLQVIPDAEVEVAQLCVKDAVVVSNRRPHAPIRAVLLLEPEAQVSTGHLFDRDQLRPPDCPAHLHCEGDVVDVVVTNFELVEF